MLSPSLFSMSNEAISKRARRLVKLLYELQLHDAEVTAPAIISLKHYLRCSKYCRAVEVMPGPDLELNIQFNRGNVSNFVLSQLEVQKLTSTPQSSSAAIFLSPLIRLILSYTPVQLSREKTVPTLFYWQSFSSHRTFCIFAFVSKESIMPSSTYSAQELLGLRELGVPVTLPDVPQKGDSPVEQQTARAIGSEYRTLGRFHKFRPYNAQELGTVRTRPNFPVLSVSSAEPEYLQPLHSQDPAASVHGVTEWRYRGRTGSEATLATEPLSAPTGVNAQQSEGFQRFYKAVISPTHVRVTAGGRVVPNTRGTSPMSKRFKDGPDDNDNAKSGAQTVDEQSHPLSDHEVLAGRKVPPMPLMAYPPHPFYPPFPASFHSMPMMHMGMGMGIASGFPYPHQALPPHSNMFPLLPASTRSMSKENPQIGAHRELSDLKPPSIDMKDAKNRRASSSQFDQQKPFAFSSQAMYPIPPPGFPSQPHGQHSFPPGLIGHTFSTAAFPSSIMGPAPVGMNPMLNPAMEFPGILPPPSANQGKPPQASSAGRPAVVPHQMPNVEEDPAVAPISSIRPSEISRKQIDMLRSSLKYHEDQLLYNKHQIDEKEMENTIKMLQSQIERFETLNQSQLRFEEEHYPKKENKAARPSSSHFRTSNKSPRNTASGQSTTKHFSGTVKRSESTRHKSALRKKEPFFSLGPVESPVSAIDPIKKSTLPSGAALAPPFEPRSLPSIGKDATENTRPAFQWDGPVADVSGNDGANGGKSESNMRCENGRLSSIKMSDAQKPYLVGTLRPGVDPKNARETDYVYERELTQDENRSRYLFLGKAPSFTRMGLPKFDGKDFYPASPSNNEDTGQTRPSHNGYRSSSREQSAECYMTSSQSKTPAPSCTPVTGQYASSFSRERPKPVKVTIRRPDSGVVIKPQKVNIKAPKPAPARVQADDVSGTRRDKTEPSDDHTKTMFLHNVLRRNMSTNYDALPGALTSATVQGVLPQYSAGYDSLMAASLSPLSPTTLGHFSPTRSDGSSSVFHTPASTKKGENRPPVDSTTPASLEQHFKDIVSLESKHSTALPAQYTGL